jgi:hypothetical protein
MRLICAVVVLFLLTSLGFAQLSPDKERFDVVLHPGEVEEKTLKVINVGDATIFEISGTEVSGDAKDFIFLSMPETKPLKPQDEAEIKIYFAIPPETKPGTYTGYIYLLDSTPPSMPLRIEFNIVVMGKENYGLSMTIDDSKSGSINANAEDTAQFELAVKNLGTFRDVASIDTSPLPEGWTVKLVDGEKEMSLPHDVSLDPGITHLMKLNVQTSAPGKKGEITLTATSLGNKTKNSSVKAEVEFGIAVRGYNVDIEVPDEMATNKTYRGSFKIMLDVKERVMIGVATPPELMVIPLTQVVDVTLQRPGVANFTMLASQPGEYPIMFKLIDSNGIPMPEEITTVKVLRPEGMVVLTGDDLLHSTVATACIPNNETQAIVTVPPGKISDKDRELLQGFAKVVILGNQSIVSPDAERSLQGAEIKRIQGKNLCEESWLFASEISKNGTAEVVLSSNDPVNIFKAYQLAKSEGVPLIICSGNVTEAAVSVIRDMTKRSIGLSKAKTLGDIGEENARALQNAGVSIEEVTQ